MSHTIDSMRTELEAAGIVLAFDLGHDGTVLVQNGDGRRPVAVSQVLDIDGDDYYCPADVTTDGVVFYDTNRPPTIRRTDYVDGAAFAAAVSAYIVEVSTQYDDELERAALAADARRAGRRPQY